MVPCMIVQNFDNPELYLKLAICYKILAITSLNGQLSFNNFNTRQRSYYNLADFLWKVSLKILNSGIIPKTFTTARLDTKDLLLTGVGWPSRSELSFLRSSSLLTSKSPASAQAAYKMGAAWP